MPDKNVVTWTSLIAGYSSNGDLGEVMSIYKHMRHEGVCCNDNTIALVFSTCGTLGDELLGQQVLGDVVKLGLQTSVSVANSLISMYGNFGNVDEACYVFDHMDERDTISWNSIISANVQNGLCEESLRCFHRMRHVNKGVNSITVSTLLGACGSTVRLKWGSGIHGLVVKLGMESNVCVGNTLLKFLVEGKILHALAVVASLQDNLIVGNALVTMYGKFSKTVRAQKVLQIRPKRDEVTWNALIGEFPYYKYAKCGDLNSSNSIFNGLTVKNSIAWNANIAANANHGLEEALKLVLMMGRAGVGFDQFSLSVALSVSGRSGYVGRRRPTSFMVLVVKLGFDTDHYISNAGHGYVWKMRGDGRCFENTSVTNQQVTDYHGNILNISFAKTWCFQKARESFQEMIKAGYET
ncbi:hypothetical protein M0R45_014250 [Rubus argutus]